MFKKQVSGENPHLLHYYKALNPNLYLISLLHCPCFHLKTAMNRSTVKKLHHLYTPKAYRQMNDTISDTGSSRNENRVERGERRRGVEVGEECKRKEKAEPELIRRKKETKWQETQ